MAKRAQKATGKWEAPWDDPGQREWRLQQSRAGRSRDSRNSGTYAAWEAEHPEDLPLGPPLTARERDEQSLAAQQRVSADFVGSNPEGGGAPRCGDHLACASAPGGIVPPRSPHSGGPRRAF